MREEDVALVSAKENTKVGSKLLGDPVVVQVLESMTVALRRTSLR
jgi:hypothetical protein